MFVITGEISCIYKRHGKTRKVHNLILLPSLEAADELSARLEGADPFLRTAFCLEVFRERQLLTLRQEGDTISITLTGQGKHVRLEESGYLQGLHEVMQPKRGGDHHD